jgi:hypothetical protein
MTATLNSLIRYDNGYIDVITSLDGLDVVEDAELVESGCKGWGDSNAVVRHGESYYLATVPTETPAELVQCDCCGGTGRVDGPTRDGYGVREDYPAEVECPHCGGTGVQEV